MFSVTPDGSGGDGGLPAFLSVGSSFGGGSLPPVEAYPVVQVSADEVAWGELARMMQDGVMQMGIGEAAQMHSEQARSEALTKLIGNHLNLLKDVCNSSPSQNIYGYPLTQLELVRVKADMAPHVDQGFREAARRLLGKGEVVGLNPSRDAIEARAQAARYLHFRIQSEVGEKPDREPDMSPEAKAAMMAVLIEVGDTNWEYLKQAIGTAPPGPSTDAARKLISNHFRVIVDACNPRGQLAISGITLTQSDLKRVPASSARHVDDALREVARRLLMLNGNTEPMDQTYIGRIARKTLATYLESRTQSEYSPQPINQHKLRKPDMSQQAADIFKATVNDVAAGIPPPYEFNGKGDTEMMNGNAPPSPVKRQSSLSSLSSLNTVQNLSGWAQLEDMLRQGASTAAQGVSGRHSTQARDEAATKIIGNHVRLIRDICNPSAGLNIDSKPLTQKELVRVAPAMQPHVDQGLREVARRLLGFGQPVMLDKSEAAMEARAAAARYLYFRIQGTNEQKPGREPDMTLEAANAMIAVMIEVGDLQWEPFMKLHKGRESEMYDPGVLAANKVVSNHFKFILDICNPSMIKNIDNIMLTQTELRRVPAKDAAHVDAALREACRILYDAVDIPQIKLDHSPAAQRARDLMVTYLETRIHTEQSMPQPAKMRPPDMSFASAQMLLNTLRSLIDGGKPISVAISDPNDGALSSWLSLEQQLSHGASADAIGEASLHTHHAREEAARKLIGNHVNLLNDVCNSSASTNIDGKPLTQVELVRVPADMKPYVDQGFREVARRLLGAKYMETLDTSEGEQQRPATLPPLFVQSPLSQNRLTAFLENLGVLCFPWCLVSPFRLRWNRGTSCCRSLSVLQGSVKD